MELLEFGVSTSIYAVCNLLPKQSFPLSHTMDRRLLYGVCTLLSHLQVTLEQTTTMPQNGFANENQVNVLWPRESGCWVSRLKRCEIPTLRGIFSKYRVDFSDDNSLWVKFLDIIFVGVVNAVCVYSSVEDNINSKTKNFTKPFGGCRGISLKSTNFEISNL